MIDVILDTLKRKFRTGNVTRDDINSFTITYATPSYQVIYSVSEHAFRSALHNGPDSLDLFVKLIKERLDNQMNKQIFEKMLEQYTSKNINITTSVKEGQEILLCNPKDFTKCMAKYDFVHYSKRPVPKNDFEELWDIIYEDKNE